MAGHQTLNQQSAPSDGAERSRRCAAVAQPPPWREVLLADTIDAVRARLTGS
jgi:hypothetical protein